jgi:type I restriction enzyme S subunit
MGIRRVSLSEVAEVSWGDTTTTKAAYVAEGFTAYSASGPDGYTVYADHTEPGVVLSAIGANCGRVWLTPSHWTCIKNTIWFRSVDPEVETRFLYYATSQPSVWPRRGSAQPFISLGDAKEVQLSIPSLSIQRKIVAFLAAYDELIENNLRRIEILEEMAHAVYRDWFVNFRFPGHEGVALVDSPLGTIPKGWGVMPFSALADFVNGFAFKPAHLGDSGLPIVKIKELKNGVAWDTPRNPGDDIPSKFHIQQGDLLFSWSADLVIQLWAHGPALLNQHLFRVLPKAPGINVDYLVHALNHRLPEFRARAQGTTMRHIKRAALSEVKVAVPSASLIAMFTESIRPMHRLVRSLVLQNANLRTTRDLLLPKLVSGEIDLSELDIDTAWMAS